MMNRKLKEVNMYYIKFKGSDKVLLNVTFYIMNEIPLPRWFRWEYYEIGVK